MCHWLFSCRACHSCQCFSFPFTRCFLWSLFLCVFLLPESHALCAFVLDLLYSPVTNVCFGSLSPSIGDKIVVTLWCNSSISDIRSGFMFKSHNGQMYVCMYLFTVINLFVYLFIHSNLLIFLLNKFLRNKAQIPDITFSKYSVLPVRSSSLWIKQCASGTVCVINDVLV